MIVMKKVNDVAVINENQETLYLLSSTRNAARLMESIEQAKKQDFVAVEW